MEALPPLQIKSMATMPPKAKSAFGGMARGDSAAELCTFKGTS